MTTRSETDHRPPTTATSHAPPSPTAHRYPLQERQFRPWWFETATPTFLVDVLTERHTFYLFEFKVVELEPEGRALQLRKSFDRIDKINRIF